jgi:LDH2 family malate/lactate/ureidoglycolate dehydrogenase
MATPTTVPHTPLSHLFAFARDALCAAGMEPGDAATVAHGLVEADARAMSSHGVVRLLPVYLRRLQRGSTNPAPSVRTVHRHGGAALVDGDGGPGQVVGAHAMELAIELARDNGVGVVGVRNSSHYGMGALYVEQAADADMVGIALTNAPSNMPPAGGRSRFFGTNPLTIGMPGADDEPMVLDMSTSVVARGKIVMAHKEGRTIPSGWAIDPDGNPTEDPEAALLGAVLPMAGYKGAGLALMIDALCGVLTGAAFGQHIVDLYDEQDRHQNVGHVFIAVAVETFMPIEAFRERMRQFAADIRAQPRQPGVDRIFLPGEIEREAAARSAEAGIAISDAGMRELDEIAASMGIQPLGDRLTGDEASLDHVN